MKTPVFQRTGGSHTQTKKANGGRPPGGHHQLAHRFAAENSAAKIKTLSSHCPGMPTGPILAGTMVPIYLSSHGPGMPTQVIVTQVTVIVTQVTQVMVLACQHNSLSRFFPPFFQPTITTGPGWQWLLRKSVPASRTSHQEKRKKEKRRRE
jgi:hypothetical protein